MKFSVIRIYRERRRLELQWLTEKIRRTTESGCTKSIRYKMEIIFHVTFNMKLTTQHACNLTDYYMV